jgi:hypothetical protein
VAATSRVLRTWLSPQRPATARATGKIVAKDTTPTVQSLLVLGETLVVTHHEGRMDSPGGVTVRRLADFEVLRGRAGSFGPLVPFGDGWLAEGRLWKGRSASLNLLDATTLAVIARFPVCKPFVVLDAGRFIAATPARTFESDGTVPGTLEVDPALVESSWVALPHPGGLVEVDVTRGKTELLVAAKGFERFRAAALSPLRDVLYATTEFGRTVAVRLSDRKTLWEHSTKWSGFALALDQTGTSLALGGSSRSGPDHFVLDARTGEVRREVNLVSLLNGARVGAARHWHVLALAFHPSGWLTASTNAGAIVELHGAGEITAFRAAPRAITSLAFSDEGRSLIVGGAERQLRVWPVDL